MRTINYVIVELDKAYENEVETESGSVIVNSTIESVSNINRVAKVKSAPSYTMLKEGDEVIVHHNIFRLRNDVKGNVTESNFFIEDNTYFVPLTEIFMYKRDSDWKPLSPFCFVEPITKEQKSGFDLSITESTHKGKIKRKGIIRYLNEELLSQGLKEGDTVLFSKNSEYEFDIDGKIHYKMSTKDILMKL